MNWCGLLPPNRRFIRRRLVFRRRCRVLTFTGSAGDQRSRRLGGRELIDQATRPFDPGVYPQLAADIRDYVFQDIGKPTPDAEFRAETLHAPLFILISSFVAPAR